MKAVHTDQLFYGFVTHFFNVASTVRIIDRTENFLKIIGHACVCQDTQNKP